MIKKILIWGLIVFLCLIFNNIELYAQEQWSGNVNHQRKSRRAKW